MWLPTIFVLLFQSESLKLYSAIFYQTVWLFLFAQRYKNQQQIHLIDYQALFSTTQISVAMEKY